MTSGVLKKLTRGFTDRSTDKIIAVADAAKQNLVDMGISPDKIEVIINGVLPVDKYDTGKKADIRKEFGIDKDAFVCGICARLEDCKGIREFYAQVGERVPAEFYAELEALEARLAK